MNREDLISKYESKMAMYERHASANNGSTKLLCQAQFDLCKEILKDLNGAVPIKVRKPRKKNLRPAKRIKT